MTYVRNNDWALLVRATANFVFNLWTVYHPNTHIQDENRTFCAGLVAGFFTQVEKGVSTRVLPPFLVQLSDIFRVVKNFIFRICAKIAILGLSSLNVRNSILRPTKTKRTKIMIQRNSLPTHFQFF